MVQFILYLCLRKLIKLQLLSVGVLTSKCLIMSFNDGIARFEALEALCHCHCQSNQICLAIIIKHWEDSIDNLSASTLLSMVEDLRCSPALDSLECEITCPGQVSLATPLSYTVKFGQPNSKRFQSVSNKIDSFTFSNYFQYSLNAH